MTPSDCWNKLVTGIPVTLDFMERTDAVNYRNSICTLHSRKYKQYVAFGLLQETPRLSVTSEITEGPFGFKMLLELKHVPRKHNGPVSFQLLGMSDA